MENPQGKLKEIRRLLGTPGWKLPDAANPDDILRAYLLAVEDYVMWDVESGISSLIKGTAPGVNPSFLPPPSVVGAECRRQMNLRLDSEHRTKLHRPALPPPDVEHTPESRARVKALVDQAVRNLGVEKEHDDADKRHRDVLKKTNAVFVPDLSDAEINRRLGWTVGDRDGEAA